MPYLQVTRNTDYIYQIKDNYPADGKIKEELFLNKNRGVQTEFKTHSVRLAALSDLFIRLLSYTFQPFHHEQHYSH
jgi:hypothetical protein